MRGFLVYVLFVLMAVVTSRSAMIYKRVPSPRNLGYLTFNFMLGIYAAVGAASS